MLSACFVQDVGHEIQEGGYREDHNSVGKITTMSASCHGALCVVSYTGSLPLALFDLTWNTFLQFYPVRMCCYRIVNTYRLPVSSSFATKYLTRSLRECAPLSLAKHPERVSYVYILLLNTLAYVPNTDIPNLRSLSNVVLSKTLATWGSRTISQNYH